MDNIRIRTHKELSGVAEKYGGFTFRQWIFIALTAIICVPIYLKLTPILGDEIVSWIVIILGLPLMACGFLTIQSLTFDRLIPFWKRHYIDFAQPLEYKTEEQLALEKEEKKTKGKKKDKKGKAQKITRAEKKRLKQERKQQIKMEKLQKKEQAIQEKKKQEQLKIERKNAKEMAKAMKWYGDLDEYKKRVIQEKANEPKVNREEIAQMVQAEMSKQKGAETEHEENTQREETGKETSED